MTNIEGSERHNQSDKPNPHEGFAIFATPFEGEQPQVRHTPDGGFTVYLRGEIHITYQPPAADAAESFRQPVDGGTFPLPTDSEELRSEPQALQVEQPSDSTDQAPSDVLKSPVTDENPPASGLNQIALPRLSQSHPAPLTRQQIHRSSQNHPNHRKMRTTSLW